MVLIFVIIYFTFNRYLVQILARTGTAVAQWLRHCAANWKVAGSIPADVVGIFH